MTYMQWCAKVDAELRDEGQDMEHVYDCDWVDMSLYIDGFQATMIRMYSIYLFNLFSERGSGGKQ